MTRSLLLIVAALALAVGPAQAQKKVYRCEVNGKVTYGDAPCKDSAEVRADDARSEAQRKAAQDVVKREEKMADQLGRERRATEAAAARQGPTGIAHSAAEKAAAAASAPPKAKAKPKPPRQG